MIPNYAADETMMWASDWYQKIIVMSRIQENELGEGGGVMTLHTHNGFLGPIVHWFFYLIEKKKQFEKTPLLSNAPAFTY